MRVQTLNMGALLQRAGCYDGEKRLIYTNGFYQDLCINGVSQHPLNR